jgi:hypothetical protein
MKFIILLTIICSIFSKRKIRADKHLCIYTKFKYFKELPSGTFVSICLNSENYRQLNTLLLHLIGYKLLLRKPNQNKETFERIKHGFDFIKTELDKIFNTPTLNGRYELEGYNVPSFEIFNDNFVERFDGFVDILQAISDTRLQEINAVGFLERFLAKLLQYELQDVVSSELVDCINFLNELLGQPFDISVTVSYLDGLKYNQEEWIGVILQTFELYMSVRGKLNQEVESNPQFFGSETEDYRKK